MLLNVFSKEELGRLVSAVMRDVVKTHGPVSAKNVDSASTRVAGTLADELVRLGRAACADAGLRLEVERLNRELAQCRKQRARVMQRRHELLELLKAHGTSPGDAGSAADEARTI